MASIRQIRRQIKSVTSTRQITKAMQMVAAAKLKKTELRLMASRPYNRKMEELLQRLMQSGTGALTNPLLVKRPIQNQLVIILTSDKGLCGSYNMNILRKAEEYLNQSDKATLKLGCIGKKARDYFSRRNYKIHFSVTDLLGNVNADRSRQIAEQVIADYLSGKFDHIDLIYTKYISTARHQPVITTYLPFDISQYETQSQAEYELDYIFEPDALTLFNEFLPRFLVTRMYSAMAESFTSEHSARMISMKNATEAAEEMIGDLTLTANKLRQSQITKEISEIVGGADALSA